MGRTRDVSKILTSNTSILTLASASSIYQTKANNGLTLLVPASITSTGGSSSVSINGTVSFSGVSSISLNDIFISNYDNYLIQWNNLTSSAATWISFRLRVSGTDETGSNYFQEQLNANGTTVTGFRSSSASSWVETILISTTYQNPSFLNLFNPFANKVTSAINTGGADVAGSSVAVQSWSRGLNTTTSYTGFTFFPTTGGSNITGSVSVYGYNK
jgi:hypothetical protein